MAPFLSVFLRAPLLLSGFILCAGMVGCEESDREKTERAQEAQLTAVKAKGAALKARCANEYEAVLAEAKAAYAKGNARAALAILYPCKDSAGGAANKDFFSQVLAVVETANKKRIAGDKIEADKTERVRLAALAKAEAAAKVEKKKHGVSIGATKQDALDSSWGRPNHINTTTTAAGTREQWVYAGRNYLYFVNGVLTSIQN